MNFNFNLVKKQSFIFKALIYMKVHVGLHIKKIKDKKTLAFVESFNNGTFFFNIKRIIWDIKQSLFFIKNILLNGGFILIICGFNFHEKQWLNKITYYFNKYNIHLINKEWTGGVLTNLFGLKKTFNNFQYSPELSIKDFYTSKIIEKLKNKRKQQINLFFTKFDILEKIYNTPDLVILLNDQGKTKGNSYLIKELTQLEIPLIAFVRSTNNSKLIDFPILCNNTSIPFLKFYLILLNRIISNFFK